MTDQPLTPPTPEPTVFAFDQPAPAHVSPRSRWKVAAAGLGSLALAGSATGYAVGRSEGKKAADKRVAVVPGSANRPVAAGKVASAEATSPAAPPTGPAIATTAAPPFPGGGATYDSAFPVGPDGAPIKPEDVFGPAPEKLFDRTVGTTTMHVYRQKQQFYPDFPEGVTPPPGYWSPPAQCRAVANVTAYVATSQFTGQASAQEYTSVDVPLSGYPGQMVGHPKLPDFIGLVPVQVPSGVKTVRLLDPAGTKVLDEMTPDKGWVVLVNPDGLSGLPRYDGPPSASSVEVVYDDGRTAKAIYDGMPGSPQAAKECQPPPPPPPTIMPDYTALTGADLDAVKAAVVDVFETNPDRTLAQTRLQDRSKLSDEWFLELKKRAEGLGAGTITINLSSAGQKGDKGVAIFQLGGTAISQSWQVVEVVKDGSGGWLVTMPSFCRIAGLAHPCPTDAFDPRTDQGPPPVDYGNGYGGPYPVATSVAPPTTALAATTTAVK
jgi:hypothetical protein